MITAHKSGLTLRTAEDSTQGSVGKGNAKQRQEGGSASTRGTEGQKHIRLKTAKRAHHRHAPHKVMHRRHHSTFFLLRDQHATKQRLEIPLLSCMILEGLLLALMRMPPRRAAPPIFLRGGARRRNRREEGRRGGFAPEDLKLTTTNPTSSSTTRRAETAARLLHQFLSGLCQLRSRFQRLRGSRQAARLVAAAAKTTTSEPQYRHGEMAACLFPPGRVRAQEGRPYLAGARESGEWLG